MAKSLIVLDKSRHWATVHRVEAANGMTGDKGDRIDWRDVREVCDRLELEAKPIPNGRHRFVYTYPRKAWEEWRREERANCHDYVLPWDNEE